MVKLLPRRLIYVIMASGGAVGLTASFLQTTEKLQLLKNADQALVCDLNSVFSCTSVLNAWQSSVFGFPNSLMCMILFTVFMTAGFIGLSGGTLPARLRHVMHGLAVFMLGFGLWFLWQSIYSIGSLCLYCLVCFTGLVMVNWAWLRLNAEDMPLLSKAGRTKLKNGIGRGADTFGWITLVLVVAFAIALKFS